MQDPMDRREHRPGESERPASPRKVATFALAVMIGVALLGGFAIALAQKDPAPDDTQTLAFADQPSAGQIEECNQYAGEVVRAGGSYGGGPVSDTDQSLVGLSDENRHSDAARAAYRDCMLGIQHDS